MIETDKLEMLIRRARQEFMNAAAYGANKVESVAILMDSGLVLSGYSQTVANLNAAKDALRGSLNSPSFLEKGGFIKEDFEIAAVVIAVATDKAKPSNGTIKSLRDYGGTKDGQIAFIVSNSSGALREVIL